VNSALAAPIIDTAVAPVELEYIPQPVPIYMLGESHCVVFTDRIFRETRHLNQTFVTRALYLPGISSHDFSDNKLARVGSALAAEHLIIGDPRGRAADWVPFHVSPNPLIIPNVHSKTPKGVPIIVVFAGEIALRSIFLSKLGQSDFELPFPAPGLDRLAMPSGHQHVPFQLVSQLANQVLGPLFSGLLGLYNMGFTSLYLHSIPPPTLSDEEFEKINGFFSPVRLRYKSALLFNQMFRDVASQTSIRFLDIWDDVTIDNALDPRFHIDGTHLNVDAAYITLQKLLTSIVRDPRVAVAGRYEFARQEAEAWFGDGAAPAPNERFAQTGLASADLGPEPAAQLSRRLDFTLDTANRHVRLDWSGGPIEPWSEATGTAQPDTAFMKELYELIYEGEVSGLIHSCLNADFAAVSVRPLRFEVDAPAGSFHTDNCPSGMLRCALHLTDGGGFEYMDADGQAKSIEARAGRLVAFDGNRLQHRWLPDSQILEMSLVARHKRLERCAIWAGMNSWPVDPFNFSTQGFVDYPAGRSHFGLIEDGAAWWLTV